MKISAVLITHNEEANIEAALRSLEGIVSEIIVVDSRSSDLTVKIAHRFTSKVFERKWTNFSDQKNYANGLAEGPWILSLDADERLSPELREEIKTLGDVDLSCAAFSMPRRVYYLGRWIKHSGWYPDPKIRLFRKNRAFWEGAYVHEDLAVDGEVGKLKGDILHFTYRNIADHLSRINVFTDLGAQKLYAQGKKCRLHHLLLIPPGRFIKSYILRGGFLDGFAGLIIAVLNGYGIFVRYAKLREIWKKGERIEPFSD